MVSIAYYEDECQETLTEAKVRMKASTLNSNLRSFGGRSNVSHSLPFHVDLVTIPAPGFFSTVYEELLSSDSVAGEDGRRVSIVANDQNGRRTGF